MLQVIKHLLENAQEVMGALSMVFAGFIVIFSIIPGDQPEKTLKGLVNFLAKFSRK